MGDLAGVVGPRSGCLPGPPCAELAGHWLVRLSHQVAGCLTPGEPRVYAGSVTGRARSWGLTAGSRGARTGIVALLHGTGSWGSWLRDPVSLRAGVGLEVGSLGPSSWAGSVCRLQGCSFPWACLCLLVADAGPKARAGSLGSGAKAQEILRLVPVHSVELGPGVDGCRALGLPGLGPVRWCVQPGPGPSGGQGVFRASCGLREALRQPSGGRDCVPT